MDRNVPSTNKTGASIRNFYCGQIFGVSAWPKIGRTLIEFGVTWEGLSAVFNIVLVISRGVFAEGSAVKAALDHLAGEFEGDGLLVTKSQARFK